MGTPGAALTERFYAWELRGRGWHAYPYRVTLEPPFRPFEGHALPRRHVRDEGRRETAFTTLAGQLLGFREEPHVPEEESCEPPEPEPELALPHGTLAELEVVLPEKAAVSPGLSEALLLALASGAHPISFEVLAVHDAIVVQLAARRTDRERVRSQLSAFFPDASVAPRATSLRDTWEGIPGETQVLEFGLAREFMLPLRTFRDFRPDPLLALFAALGEVERGEAALYQVIFTPALFPWAESAYRAVHTERGEPFFADHPEFTKHATEKIARPLFAVALRIAVKTGSEDRTWHLLQGLSGATFPFAEENELVPLAAEEGIALEADLLLRMTHRTGMLLAVDELASLVHLPHESVRLPTLPREVRRTKAPPREALGEGVALGVNLHEGRETPVRLPRDLRMRHVHVVGTSGSGKSTLLARMILEDVEKGEGVALLDPHGDLVDEILTRFPEERESDLILFDPGDEDVALGWNMLGCRTETEKILLSSDLVGVFRRLSTSWGDQMNSVLANAILAFLESNRGGTLLDLRRFLVDREFRAAFLETVEDPEVRYYWQKEFPLLKGLPQAPILTRLDTFLRPKLVRRVVVEREHELDFREIVDRGRVFLAKLAQGAIGEENAALLGSLVVSAFHQAAISRQETAPQARRHFFLYLDEFHEMATPSMAALLTGARKYRLGLTLAHQELRQLEARNREVASALLANAAVRIVFRVGEEDARALERGFSAFTSGDLGRLGVGEAVVRIERSDQDFTLRAHALPPVAEETASARRERIASLMRERFPSRLEAEAPAPTVPTAPPRTEASPALPPRPPRRDRKPEPRPAPPALGRGGPEHQYLQELVSRWGEAKGFRVTIEAPIAGGRGSVDVALERHDLRLACEISVTSTVAQEVENLEKCLGAGFDRVVLVSRAKSRMRRVEAALEKRLPAEARERLLFLTPEELFSFLDARPAPEERTRQVGGYRVAVTYRTEDAKAGEAKRKAVAQVIAQSLGRIKGEGS